MHPQASDKLWFLLIKYQTEAALSIHVKTWRTLVISDEIPGVQLADKPMEIVDAYYGNNEYAHNAMQRSNTTSSSSGINIKRITKPSLKSYGNWS